MGCVIKLLSAEYQQQLRILHAGRPWGYGGYKYGKAVSDLAKSVNARTVLDYGCGIGTLKLALQLEPLIVYEYDPGVIEKDSPPKPADILVCTDVLEHIEPDYFHAVLDHMQQLMLNAGFVVISTREAKSVLPDGRNAHLIVRDFDWWIKMLSRRWKFELKVSNEADQIAAVLRNRRKA